MDIEKVKASVNSISSTVEDSNLIIDLHEILMKTEDDELLTVLIPGMQVFFLKGFQERNIHGPHCMATNGSDLNATKHYNKWMRMRYNDFCKELLEKIVNVNKQLRLIIMESIVKLIEAEVKSYSHEENLYFPEKLLQDYISNAVSHSFIDELCEVIKYYLYYDDFRHFIIMALKSILKTSKDTNVILNTFDVLVYVADYMPKLKQKKLDFKNTMVNIDLEEPKIYKQLNLKEHRKKYEETWLLLFKRDLSANMIKKILVVIHEVIIPHFCSPCLLADFLSNSYKQGGGLALLSLHGLFILMTEHNLEYPEFYKQLYSLIHPRIFSAKYAPRFFHLLDIFLSSSHLPAYLIAAFTKKLSRMMLIAPTHSQVLLIQFVTNLVRQHEYMTTLIDRTVSGDNKGILNDPFNETENDPNKCKALESSLWELEAMKQHYHPEVSKLASLSTLPIHDYKINEVLETSYIDLFSDAIGSLDDAPMNFIKPTSFLRNNEDSFIEIWKL